MRLVKTTLDTLRIQPKTAVTYRSSRLTQLKKQDSENGLVSSRGQAFRAVYVKKPFIVVSITPIDMNGAPNLDILANMLCRSSIDTYDSFGTSTSSDPFNVDAYLFETKGRLRYDLTQYATSALALKFLSTYPARFNLQVRTEIFSMDDDDLAVSAQSRKRENQAPQAAMQVTSSGRGR